MILQKKHFQELLKLSKELSKKVEPGPTKDDDLVMKLMKLKRLKYEKTKPYKPKDIEENKLNKKNYQILETFNEERISFARFLKTVFFCPLLTNVYEEISKMELCFAKLSIDKQNQSTIITSLSISEYQNKNIVTFVMMLFT
jgi:hypothetical protein